MPYGDDSVELNLSYGNDHQQNPTPFPYGDDKTEMSSSHENDNKPNPTPLPYGDDNDEMSSSYGDDKQPNPTTFNEYPLNQSHYNDDKGEMKSSYDKEQNSTPMPYGIEYIVSNPPSYGNEQESTPLPYVIESDEIELDPISVSYGMDQDSNQPSYGSTNGSSFEDDYDINEYKIR